MLLLQMSQEEITAEISERGKGEILHFFRSMEEMTKKRSSTAPGSKEQQKVALNQTSIYTKAC